MTLYAGDLTTPARAAAWLGQASAPANFAQLVTSMSALIYSKLNRARLYSQSFSRVFEGVGNYQLVLPDWPVTAIASVQVGSVVVPAAPLPPIVNGVVNTTNSTWGYRYAPWLGNLPGDPAILEFNNGTFWCGVQNIRVIYTAGYIEVEAGTVPANPGPYTIDVLQPQGIWCRDNGVIYTATGIALTPVSTLTAAGQYKPPDQNTGGTEYTFYSGDANANVTITYSFIPADLEEACIQMVAERNSYTSRVGQLDKSLGGQETIRFLRGGNPRSTFPDLPPEVEGLIWPYVSVTPPAIGAPV